MLQLVSSPIPIGEDITIFSTTTDADNRGLIRRDDVRLVQHGRNDPIDKVCRRAWADPVKADPAGFT